MSVRFKPLYDYILIKEWAKPEQLVRGIYVPNVEEIIVKTEVVAVGNGHLLPSGELKALTVQVGDIVYVNKTAAQFDIKEDDVKYYLIHERDILGIDGK